MTPAGRVVCSAEHQVAHLSQTAEQGGAYWVQRVPLHHNLLH